MAPTDPPPSAPRPERWRIVAALIALYLIWGSTYLAIQIALTDFPPFGLAAAWFMVAGLGLLAVLLVLGWRWPTARQLGNTAVMGTLLLAGGNGFVCYAQQSVSSGLAAVAVAAMPLYAALFAGFAGRWPSRRDALGLAIGFGGVVLLNAGGELRASPEGAVALLVAPMLWAAGSIWSHGRDLPDAWMSTALQMVLGGTVLTGVSLALGEQMPAAPSWASIGAIAYLAVFGSLVGFTAYLYLLRTVRPAVATSYAYVNPPVAIAFGMAFAGERLHLVEAVATAVILAGVVVVLTGRK
jgi:drug/metabolite transporter (DMT)-like permease